MTMILAIGLGSLLGIFFLTALWEFFLFKRVCNDPVVGKISSTAAAYVTAVIIFAFRSANGLGWDGGSGVILYLPAALLVGTHGYLRGKKLRAQMAAGSEIFE